MNVVKSVLFLNYFIFFIFFICWIYVMLDRWSKNGSMVGSWLTIRLVGVSNEWMEGWLNDE